MESCLTQTRRIVVKCIGGQLAFSEASKPLHQFDRTDTTAATTQPQTTARAAQVSGCLSWFNVLRRVSTYTTHMHTTRPAETPSASDLHTSPWRGGGGYKETIRQRTCYWTSPQDGLKTITCPDVKACVKSALCQHVSTEEHSTHRLGLTWPVDIKGVRSCVSPQHRAVISEVNYNCYLFDTCVTLQVGRIHKITWSCGLTNPSLQASGYARVQTTAVRTNQRSCEWLLAATSEV